ncbi:Gfo/Idh/MocA family oxidoreductase [Victivallaceae bacterium BBE-744-WT-12]|uniref:Gfo/Idh/MocA family oxidoreductase n=1 Tax=Victivallis lenta TaxID=2606640 RepID=A0A844G6U9_9BACT|nr:Gfo/Idh/MocA family oxidoreductase [Victivallis lenta]MST98863.1 Gfo/Idh/MocA family oxidoreductase [Victivallis lenta]
MGTVFKTGRRIKLGIWGLCRGVSFGNIAGNLQIDVIAGCDIDAGMREKFRKNYPDVQVFADENEFLSTPGMDAVLIATFFDAHAEHAIKALNAGMHVMCEVTGFFTPADGVRLVEAVERSGKVFNLLENYPFTKQNMYLQALWDKGFFGEFLYGECEYLHNCRDLIYGNWTPSGTLPRVPGCTMHNWRSWLNFHYYNTHSLGPLMKITGLRPIRVTAPAASVQCPGFPRNSGMGKMCPSFVEMSNGAVMRNLMGAATNDSPYGCRLWGSRASLEAIGDGLRICVGARGDGRRLKVDPQWAELGELADAAGHNGGDFWEIYYFVREILTGEKAPWGIYDAADVTLAGISAVRSETEGGIPVEVPDFRDPAVRDQYRNDHFLQKRLFDPANVFPADCDHELADTFCKTMLDIEKFSGMLRDAFDGAVLWKNLSDDYSRLTVCKAVNSALEHLADLFTALEQGKKIMATYPDGDPATALRGIISLAMPECDEPETLVRQKLEAIRTEFSR